MANTTNVAAKEKTSITYRYKATDNQGKEVKGTVKAASEIAAERLVIEQGYWPINIEVLPSMFSLEEAFPSFFKVKIEDVIVFSRQLATLIRAGISLLPALEILQGQTSTGMGFRRIQRSIINEISAGGSFSQAIAKHPDVFSEVYSKTIAVGEQTGSLVAVLNRMADYFEKQDLTMKKVRRALTYPAIVLSIGVGVSVLLMTFVLPQMLGMFTAMNAELPLPTRILIGLTDFVSANSLYLLVAGTILGASILWLVKQPTGRQLLDRLMITMPIIGSPIHLGELARLSRTMSILVSSGLHLQEIVAMMRESSTNLVFKSALGQVSEGLLLGEGLSQPMSRISLFPSLLVTMVAVGEESNTLDTSLGVVADFYESTAEQQVDAMVGLIAPLSTIILAGLVGFLALAIVMPIYNLTGLIGN